jgi:hypothetical protein
MGITIQHTEECLCAAHIAALAGMAGAALGVHHFHDYGVDGQFDPVIERGTRRVISGFPLPFQAKATINWQLRNGHIVYSLETKTYNDIVLRSEAEATLLLVLLCLPKGIMDWHSATAEQTVLRNCCYWHILRGDPVRNENSTKRIAIPEEQLLTPDSLNHLLAYERARREAQIR